MSEEIKVYINSNEDGFITDCYFADNTKVSCEFYHEESEIEYSNCKLLNLQDYIKEKDQRIAKLEQDLKDKESYGLALYSVLYEKLEKEDPENVSSRIQFLTGQKKSLYDDTYKTIKNLQEEIKELKGEKQ